MKDNEINQWKLEVEGSMIIIIGFAVMTFAVWRLYKHFENRYTNMFLMETLGDRVDAAELRMDGGD